MISVITTTYNCAPYVFLAIKSILNQTFKDFEYLIVDDGSDDNTEIIVSKINDKRIRYIKLGHMGRPAALNKALTLANYETIALMDADDISHPRRLEKQLELFNNKNQFIFSETAFFKNEKIIYIITSPNDSKELMKKLVLHGHFNNSSSIFNKNFVLANGGYNENLLAYEDYDLWLRLINKSEFLVLPGINHYMRLHKNSMTTSDPSKLKHILYKIQEPYFKDLSSSFGFTDTLEQNILKGWREFFYGAKSLARKYWRKVDLSNRSMKVILLSNLTYLPNNLFEIIINNRLRLRYQYIFNKIHSSKNIQKEFKTILSDLYLDM